MIFRPSPLVGALSGTLGDITFAYTPAGSYMRKAQGASKTATPKQLRQRTRMKHLLRGWRGLTAAEQVTWAQLAASHPYKNRLGVLRHLTGFQLFLKVNGPETLFLDSFLINAPLGTATQQHTSLGPNFSLSGTFVLNKQPASVPGIPKYRIDGARSFSTSRPRHFATWRNIYFGDNPGNLHDFKSEFITNLGTPGLGEKVAVRAYIWSTPQLPGPIIQQATTILA